MPIKKRFFLAAKPLLDQYQSWNPYDKRLAIISSIIPAICLRYSARNNTCPIWKIHGKSPQVSDTGRCQHFKELAQ